MLPTTGSRMTQAMGVPAAAAVRNDSSAAPRSLNRAVNVSAATAAGTPGESGSPSVAAPDPAFTSNPSECP